MAPNCPPPKTIRLPDVQRYQGSIEAAQRKLKQMEIKPPFADHPGISLKFDAFKTSSSSDAFLSSDAFPSIVSGISEPIPVYETEVTVPMSQADGSHQLGSPYTHSQRFRAEMLGSNCESDPGTALLHAKIDHLVAQMEISMTFTKAIYKKTKRGRGDVGLPFLRSRQVSRGASFYSKQPAFPASDSGTTDLMTRVKSGDLMARVKSGTSITQPITEGIEPDQDEVVQSPYISERAVETSAMHTSGAAPFHIAHCSPSTQRVLDISEQIAARRKSRRSGVVWRFLEDKRSSRFARIYSHGRGIFMAIAFLLAWMQVVDMPGTSKLDSMFRGSWMATPIQIIIESLFGLEVTIRFLACQHKLIFWLNLYNVIDLMSALPLIIRVLVLVLNMSGRDVTSSSEVYAFFGIVPVLRLLKYMRRFETFQLLLTSFRGALQALPVLIFTMFLIAFSFAAVIYYFEPRDNVPTLLTSVCFVMVTLSTVGYGDYSPQSVVGKLATIVLIVVGILYMAIPIGIVGNSFSQVWEDRHRLLLMQRMRNRIINAGYSPEDLKVLFGYLDKDQSGALDYDEFVGFIELLQIDMEEKFIAQVFECFDDDDEGTIDFREFIRGLFPKTHWLMNTQSAFLPGAVTNTRCPDRARLEGSPEQPGTPAACASNNTESSDERLHEEL